MENYEQKNPELDQTKAQPEQAQQQQQPETGESQSFETGQADYGSAGDLAVEQRQDSESGDTLRQPETGEAQDSFIGSQSDDDSSEDLIERDAE
ncbi:hypothetical protein [Sphingomonas jaspsi]|uniref:hypothetical protein n=1 Tax=Sphingomonas jaspsi TaxID=392409 RepID=UPI0004AD8312|nr:hypothetical protein [Sphingomonas jaspsi]